MRRINIFSIQLLFIVYLIGLCPSLVHSFYQWRVYKSADIENTDQNTLRFFRKWNGPIVAMFILKPAIPGVFSTRLPVYRIDSNPVHRLEMVDNLKTDRQTWIKWEIDNGQGKISEGLLEFMRGKVVTFQYYKPDGEISETTFPLVHAGKAITELLK